MNILIQERHNHSENCSTVKLSRKTNKVEIYLANEGSGLSFFSTGHTFGSNVGNEFGVMLRGKESHKPEFGYNIVRIHSLITYTDLIEYRIVGVTKTVLLRSLRLFSKFKAGDNMATGQYMNYQTFKNMQLRPLLKNFFHSYHIDFRDTTGEKRPFVTVGITRFVLMLKKASNIHFQPKRH